MTLIIFNSHKLQYTSICACSVRVSVGHSLIKPASVQVLPLKAGRPSVATTWLLESPGHLVNKFTLFVRVIFTERGDGKAQGGSASESGEAERKESDETEGVVTSVTPSRASTEVADKVDQEGVTDSNVTLPPVILKKQLDEGSKIDDKDSRLSLKGKKEESGLRRCL